MTEQNQPGPYVVEFGDVWFRPPQAPRSPILSDKRHVCRGSEMMAVCYDREDGTLHKHGAELPVTAWADKTMRTFYAQGLDEVADALELIFFPPTPECLDELNACIATTGRILQIADRLQAIADAIPKEQWPVVYPR